MESARFFDYMPGVMSDILSSSSSPGRFDEVSLVLDIGSLKEFQEAPALLTNLVCSNNFTLGDPFHMARNECNNSLNWLEVDSPDSTLLDANLEYDTHAACEASMLYPEEPHYNFNCWAELGYSSSCSCDNESPNYLVHENYWANGSMPLLLSTNLLSENTSMAIQCHGLESFALHDLGLALNEDNDVISIESLNSDQQSCEMSTTCNAMDQKRKMVDLEISDHEISHGKRLCTGEQSVGLLSQTCNGGQIAGTSDNRSEPIGGSSDRGIGMSSKSQLAGITSIAPRARRCSASNPQSLYARNRREKINERLKILQCLIPNGTKVDISTMLEQAIDYVKFMQLQIKLLSSDEHWMYTPIAFNAGMDVQAALGLNSTI